MEQHILSIPAYCLIIGMQLTIAAGTLFRKVSGRDQTTWCTFRCFPRGCCGQRPQEHVGSSQSRLATRLSEMNAAFATGMAHVFSWAAPAWAGSSFFRIVTGLPAESDPFITNLYLVMYISSILMLKFPELLKRYLLLIVQVWLQGLTFCFGAYCAVWWDSRFQMFKVNFALTRICLGIAQPLPSMHLFWNLAWVVPGVIGDSSGSSMLVVGVNEVLVAVFITYVTSTFEEIQKSQVLSDIQAGGYLRAKRTMERLLANMCDAVVELDPELRIRQASPKLAGVLLRDTGITALRGETFSDLAFNEADRDRFRDFVAQRAVPMAHEENIDDDKGTSSMYMNLRDSSGTQVCVQVFHSCHHDPDDQLCHIVGVHEVEKDSAGGEKDTFGAGNWREGLEHPPLVPDTRLALTRETLGQLGRQGGLGIESESVASVASSVAGSEASDVSVHTVPVVPHGEMSPITVYFDAATDEIVASTIDFQSITGPLRFKTNLAEIIVNFEEFHVWLVAEMQTLLSGGESTKFEVRIAPVVQRRRAHFEFESEVGLLEADREALGSQLGVEDLERAAGAQRQLLLALIFAAPVPKWQRKGTRGDHRRSRARPPKPESELQSEAPSQITATL